MSHGVTALPGLLAGLAAAALLAGCANRPINDPIERVDPAAGYRPKLLIPERVNNDPSTLFILTFSGGGMRAAALSYGVLQELRGVEIATADGHKRRLLDEVDLISGVSGGSFTALAYALYGDRLFDEYEQRFLKRDVEGALASRSFLNPANWFRQMSPHYGRSEVAEKYYDEILFENATFNDLLDKHDVPVAVANGTDITTGYRLAFFQDEFDLLCSDLGTVHLSRAAAASSAVPLVLSPVTFNNYGGNCDYQWPPWVEDLQKHDPHLRPVGLAVQRYQGLQLLHDGRSHPYIHLVDGGVADNIGVRGVLEAMEELHVARTFGQAPQTRGIRRIFLIVVNAHSSHTKNWEQKESPPGMFKQITQVSGVPIARTSFETVELLKDNMEAVSFQRRLMVAQDMLAGASREEAEARYPELELQVAEVGFNNVQDPKRRAYFDGLPTSFVLKPEDVDKLEQVAGELLRQSPAYQRMLHDLRADGG